MDPSDPVLVEVVRGGWVESVHRGRMVVLDGSGRATTDLGAVADAVLLRSCAKPLQAVAMVRAGWDPPTDRLALACASHDGTDAHLAVVRATLAAAGLTEGDLGCPPGYALDPEAGAYQRVTEGPDRIHHGCSGKHAAMLATCRHRGWPTDGYLDPGHPLQQAIRATVEELAGTTAAHVAVDGCGAPVAALPLSGLARAVATVARGGPGTAEGRVADAMRRHPELVAGDRRSATRLMRAVPGLIAKDGAEGVYVAALPDGRAVAVKVDDGAVRASEVVVASAIAHLVGEDDPAVDLDVLADVALPDVEGGGRPVGEIRSVV
ncbi:MAG TPA: asparaginase [Iamia sp.]|nr:asparaginase [Iamia sp.]